MKQNSFKNYNMWRMKFLLCLSFQHSHIHVLTIFYLSIKSSSIYISIPYIPVNPKLETQPNHLLLFTHVLKIYAGGRLRPNCMTNGMVSILPLSTSPMHFSNIQLQPAYGVYISLNFFDMQRPANHTIHFWVGVDHCRDVELWFMRSHLKFAPLVYWESILTEEKYIYFNFKMKDYLPH
jgi:hypothetical protein